MANWPELVGSAILPDVVAAHGKARQKHQWLVFAILAAFLVFSKVRLILHLYPGCFVAPRIFERD
jgi:hypothetical protein